MIVHTLDDRCVRVRWLHSLPDSVLLHVSPVVRLCRPEVRADFETALGHVLHDWSWAFTNVLK